MMIAGHMKIVIIVTAFLSFFIVPASLSANETFPDMRRYFFSGDGVLSLYNAKTKISFSGTYRKEKGTYDGKAVHRICQVFGAPCDSSGSGLSMRLVEFMDYLEDHLNKGAKITIVSGYRKPEYNSTLRNKGMLAAKASLHQYGMAADLKIQGVKAARLWQYVKDLRFGGAGYYHGSTVHIDVGPARFWDETTSGVGTGLSDDNKLIGIETDYDIYRPGMTVIMRFIRMTAFPIRVATEFSLVRLSEGHEGENCRDFVPAFIVAPVSKYAGFNNVKEMSAIRWQLPLQCRPGRYTIRVSLCNNEWPDMPVQIETPEFEISGNAQ
jgi:uncharacterized protein YcbK (DUF882 family)